MIPPSSNSPSCKSTMFLEAWQSCNYGQMATCLPKIHRGPTVNAGAGKVRAAYEQDELTAFEILRLTMMRRPSARRTCSSLEATRPSMGGCGGFARRLMARQPSLKKRASGFAISGTLTPSSLARHRVRRDREGSTRERPGPVVFTTGPRSLPWSSRGPSIGCYRAIA